MVLDKSFPPDPRVENEALALIEAGHQVFLFCLTLDRENDAEHKGIAVKRYQSNIFEYKLSALAYSLPLYEKFLSKKIDDFVRNNAPDILHVHDMVVAGAVFRTNRKFGLPVVLDLHENRPEIMKTYPHMSKFLGRLLISTQAWKEAEAMLVRKADRTIVVTRESKEELMARTGVAENKIKVVPNTVKRSFYRDYTLESSILEKYEGKFVVLYLGDTGLRRGLVSMIQAMAIVTKDTTLRKQIKLVIVGSNSTDEVLKNSVTQLGLEDVVDFEGWKNEAFFPSYLLTAAVGVSPLLRNPHHDTTYANKLFQYMSFGVPVLVSDATAQKNLIEAVDSGLVHRENDPADIAEKLLMLFKNQNLSKAKGLRGKEFIDEKFNWEQVSVSLKDLYLEFKNN